MLSSQFSTDPAPNFSKGPGKGIDLPSRAGSNTSLGSEDFDTSTDAQEVTDLNTRLDTDDGVSGALVRSEDVGEDVELNERAFSDESTEVDQAATFERVRGGRSRERNRVGRRDRNRRGEREHRRDDGGKGGETDHGDRDGW